MQRDNLNDLFSFLTVATEGNFTRAAAKLGVSQSALSYTIKALEKKLGIRLLTRTTRSVAPTEAGQRLLLNIGPHLDAIQEQLDGLNDLRDKPAGNIRLTMSDFVADTILWPKLSEFLHHYPDIKVELHIDYGLTDIVKQQFDAGIRDGEQIPKDMIAVRISPDTRMTVVGSKDYFKAHTLPTQPQELVCHSCINLRLPTYGGLYVWEFEKDGQKQNIRVEGQLTFNRTDHMLQAALDDYGLAYIPEELAKPYIEDRRLISVLDDWLPYFPGFHLYYPNRRQPSPAFTLLVNMLKYKG